MGENPMMSDPNTSHVEEKLRSLDLLIARDWKSLFNIKDVKIAGDDPITRPMLG